MTPRAVEVLRRAFELGRMDPASVGVRISTGRGLRGEEARTGFADQPEPHEVTIEVEGLRLFVPRALEERGAVVDVADEHDRIILISESEAD